MRAAQALCRAAVEAGWFVTYLEGQQYVLGKTEAGIRPAVREAMQLCNENRMAQ
jgi:hypothetical protein